MTTPLQKIITAEIKANGAMPMDRFMAMALTHPEHGYYMNRSPFNKDGDFITSPEISQMFGELIGLWCFEQLAEQNKIDEAGLMELGPGRGTLMADALRALAPISKGKSWPVHFVERSFALRQQQIDTIAPHAVSHTIDLLDLPPYPLAFIANEFFDALPIKQYEYGQGQWQERCITADDGRLALTLRETEPETDSLTLPPADDGTVAEIAPKLHLMIEQMSRHIKTYGGAALIIDYGKDNAMGDSLQGVRAHRPVDILDSPGQTDLSAWVDFSTIRKAAEAAETHVVGTCSQGDFLKNLGLYQRAEALSQGQSPETRRSLAAEVDRLSSPAQMGRVFKVMAILPESQKNPISGFSPP